MVRLEDLRIDLFLMAQTLEDLGKERTVKVLDTRAREKQGKRIWLSEKHENSLTVPIIKMYTGKSCAAGNTPIKTASNRVTASGGLS